MFCANCGSKVEINQNFCMKCGEYIKGNKEDVPFLYELKTSLMTTTELEFYKCIIEVLPEGYQVHPQANLAAFIIKKYNTRYQNELFRNVDFLITDKNFKPILIIEINDKTHLEYSRKIRDEKVSQICREAGIPIMNLWTKYGINREYIKNKIIEKINTPIIRKHNFEKLYTFNNTKKATKKRSNKKSSKGCLTAVLGIIFLINVPCLFMVVISLLGKI